VAALAALAGAGQRYAASSGIAEGVIQAADGIPAPEALDVLEAPES
jgi:hypothetical protein